MNKFLKIIFVFLLFLPVLVFAQTEKKKALFFYSENCPHCREVEEYFQKEKIYEKYEIKKIDVAGEYNAAYLNEFFDSFNIAPENRGWPAVFFDNEILVGSRPIIENFVSKIETANGSEFPSPTTVEKSFLKMKEKLDKGEQSLRSVLLVVLGAGLADSINPCVFPAIFILLFILRPGCLKNRFYLALAGFLAVIFLARFFLGILLYQDAVSLNFFRPILAIAGILAATLGVFSLRYPTAVISRVVYGIKNSFLSFSWLSFLKGLAAGAICVIFLLPNSQEPYAPLVKIISERFDWGKATFALSVYNFLFIIPLAAVALLINFLANKTDARKFYIKNAVFVRVVCGAAMVFAGAYIIKISF